jgi:hypothetical protein
MRATLLTAKVKNAWSLTPKPPYATTSDIEEIKFTEFV